MEEQKESRDSLQETMAYRDKIIVRTSIIGILVNVLLSSFKLAVGLISHSIAVMLDAVNNLSDALSSVITIVGTKLANKAPDKKHPLGYGRIEYLSALIVAGIVLYAGITSLVGIPRMRIASLIAYAGSRLRHQLATFVGVCPRSIRRRSLRILYAENFRGV